MKVPLNYIEMNIIPAVLIFILYMNVTKITIREDGIEYEDTGKMGAFFCNYTNFENYVSRRNI